MKRAQLRLLGPWRQPGRAGASRLNSSFSESLYRALTSRQLPLFFDYLHPQPSHLLNLTLTDLLPRLDPSSRTQTALPSTARPSHLPPGHHLVYFPPQVTLSQLLPDGTDTLHTPGTPFNRRLWAGGKVEFPAARSLLLDGSRAVCIEGIRDVIVKGQPGEEKIIVQIERQIGTVRDEESENDTRKRIWSNNEGERAHTSIIEIRDLVFMRDKTAGQLEQDKAEFCQASRAIKCPTDAEFRYQLKPTKALLFRFSALTFNAHLIHLDKDYTRNVEGYRNLLVHGPLTLTLLLTALRHHLEGKGLAIRDIEYKNLAPVYVEEELTICGKPKPTQDDAWDVWIEGKDGGLAVRGTVHLKHGQKS
ncbi:hypothetical protein BDW59DRAFT_147979 [Aspergillus cavernicola]|uniref:HotDog domain-containing protein n=1 Tax=Aspergillus cavernicola TaxID=176166 RepID=A0ABR4I898_9EURO